MPTRWIKAFVCKKCGHEWIKRGNRRPRMCPKCKTVNWDDGEGEGE